MRTPCWLTAGLVALCALGALAQEAPAPEETTERAGIAVFRFANQTYDEALDRFEGGMRDIVAQTLSQHPGLAAVTPDKLDEAIRKAGWNPRRTIPYGAALRIAKELGARYAVSGTLTSVAGGTRAEAQLVLVDDPSFVWTPQRTGPPDAAELEATAVWFAREVLEDVGLDATTVSPSFWVGSWTTIRLKTDAPDVTLRLAGPAEEASWKLRDWRITGGTSLSQAKWDEAGSEVTLLATAPGEWEVELGGVLSGSATQLRFAIAAAVGSTVELEFTNRNVVGQPRSAKTYRMAIDTPRADVLVDAEGLWRDGPLWVLALPFERDTEGLPVAPAVE